MTTLIDAINDPAHVACIRVYVAGQVIPVDSVRISQGWDVISAAVQVVPNASWTWPTTITKQTLEILLGYNNMYLTVFKGFIEQDKREVGVAPYFIAAGNMKRTQYQHNGALSYASQTDTAIAQALLSAAGVPQFDVQGAGTSLATVKALALRDGQPTFTLLNIIDQTMGYITADNPGGAVRRTLQSMIPATNGAWSYSTNIVSIKRRRSIRGVHNHVRVAGIQSYGATAEIAPSDSAYEFRSEAVQGNTLAGTIATRILHEVNRQIDEVVVTIPGNPYLNPGMTVTITNASVGLGSATPYLIRHVVHDYDATGLVDTVYLEGGPASDGYAATAAPHAEFTFTVLKTIDSASVVHYGISCDASGSWDADSAPNSLTYAWTDNKSTSGTGKYFTLNLVAADLSPIPTITLTVTDTDALTDAATQAIDIAGGSVDIALRALYVAASSQAEATADGTTWNTWAPGSGTVISTAQNSPNYGLFGLSDGKLYHTADYLATSPTLVHTFGAAVNAMWINENTPNRVIVGLADGTLYLCTDISTLGSSSWSLIHTYAAAVKWVVENADASQIWVCSGIYVYVNHTIQATAVDITNSLAMSYFGNYACVNYTGSGSSSPSYTNPLGGGAYGGWQATRVGQVIVTSSMAHRKSPFSGGDGTWDMVVDGSNGFFIDVIGSGAGNDVTGDWIKYDFGTPQLITEHHGWHQAGSAGFMNGYFKWQACNDDASWVDISAPFLPQGGYEGYTDTSLSGNTNFYRYYRMLGTSGTWTAGIFSGTMHSEECFKITGAAPAVVIISADDGSTKLTVTVAIKAITHHIRNGVCWAMDDNGYFYELADGGSTFTDLGDSSCGLAYAMHRDGDNQDTIYLGTASGFWVSFNRGRVWTKLRDYSGAGLDGLAIGYGARSLA